MGMRRAVFLDRDGVINADRGYVGRYADFIFLPGVAAAMARLRSLGFVLVMVTNQSGIARGYFTEHDFRMLCAQMQHELRAHGAQFDRICFCPHLPGAAVARYDCECACRKPRPGMLLQAIRDLGLDAQASFMVGDRRRDLEAGQAAGVGRLVRVGGVAGGEDLCDNALCYASLHDFVFSYAFGSYP